MYIDTCIYQSIVASFPRCRLILLPRLLRDQLSLHILIVVYIEELKASV